ncbi:DUF1990 domain-containing protein [Nocardia tengchongensis]|uniref:DUF1990 domain-containing protein n=1 Tax=Nocardia tengchongensis TaxID=2055889 RepID=A0ABX8CLS5_9NOCA|nr:DUF1990 domain-containing protein [Nocardia tengchongensis]
MQRGTGIFQHATTPTAQPGTELTVRLALGPIGVNAPCRVVYVLDDPNRRGFAYGTLPGHPESGEELFAVEYDPADDSVHGIIAAFSNPGTWYNPPGRPDRPPDPALVRPAIHRDPATPLSDHPTPRPAVSANATASA